MITPIEQYLLCDGTNHFQFGGHLLWLIALLLLEVCTSNFENGISSTTPRFGGIVLFDHFTSARFCLTACRKEACSMKSSQIYF